MAEPRDAHFPDTAEIDAYGNGGFRFAGMSHRGSLLCLPSGIYGWEPKSPDELTPDMFVKVVTDASRIEFLLIGMGTELRLLKPELKALFKKHGMSSDPMSTGAAIRTYNIMLMEKRPVAAALIAV